MSKEFRNTPDLWIVIYIFVPENDSCLLVDILAALFEKLPLALYVCIYIYMYVCLNFIKTHSCRENAW